MRRCVVIALSTLSACQCLQPVDERADAGLRDGGSGDARTDAGVACITAADCTAPGPVQQFCGGLRAACVNNHCLLECPVPDAGQRTCQSDTTECLT